MVLFGYPEQGKSNTRKLLLIRANAMYTSIIPMTVMQDLRLCFLMLAEKARRYLSCIADIAFTVWW